MKSNMRNTVQTTLQCPKCGRSVDIFRKMSRQKKNGHVKHMLCPYCQETVPFVETKNK